MRCASLPASLLTHTGESHETDSEPDLGLYRSLAGARRLLDPELRGGRRSRSACRLHRGRVPLLRLLDRESRSHHLLPQAAEVAHQQALPGGDGCQRQLGRPAILMACSPEREDGMERIWKRSSGAMALAFALATWSTPGFAVGSAEQRA